MRTSTVLLQIALVAASVCLAGCIYQHKTNNLSYILNTKYNVFDIKEEPDLSFSNFVGYCIMPMANSRDVRGKEALELIDQYIAMNGYTKVLPDEMLNSKYVASKTFLVSLGYVETFTEGKIEVVLNLHAVDHDRKKDVVFWSWQAEYEGYPLSRKTLEPALSDIFRKEPIDWQRHDRLFPLLCATSNTLQSFVTELERAREPKSK